VRGEDILNVLLDVEWVVGSFVADASGQLLLHQMPPEFGEAELERTTVRLASIVRCAELCELGVEQCAFSLNRYQLSMTRFRGGFLCVMVEAPVNRRALEMATRIAVESLPQLIDSLAASGSGPPDEMPLPRPAAAVHQQVDQELNQEIDPNAALAPGEPVRDDDRGLDPLFDAGMGPDLSASTTQGNDNGAELDRDEDDTV
jgi:hypothetical protein